MYNYYVQLCINKNLFLLIFSPVPASVTDVVIALDGSSELSDGDFEKLKEFAKNIVNKFKISKPGTHIGVIEYSDEVNVKISLGSTHDPTQLKRLIDDITPSRGTQRFTAQTLTKAAKEIFPVSFNGRPGANRILVLVTAGPSTDVDGIAGATKETEKAGVNVFVVSVKDPTDDVKDLTPDSNIVDAKGTDNLPSTVETLFKIIKKSIEESK